MSQFMTWDPNADNFSSSEKLYSIYIQKYNFIKIRHPHPTRSSTSPSKTPKRWPWPQWKVAETWAKKQLPIGPWFMAPWSAKAPCREYGDDLWQQKTCGQGVFLWLFFVWLNLLHQSNLIVYATVTPCYTFTAVFVFPAICLHRQSLRDLRYVKLQIVAFKCDHPLIKNWNQHQKTCSAARISRWIFKYTCLMFIIYAYVNSIHIYPGKTVSGWSTLAECWTESPTVTSLRSRAHPPWQPTEKPGWHLCQKQWALKKSSFIFLLNIISAVQMGI